MHLLDVRKLHFIFGVKHKGIIFKGHYGWSDLNMLDFDFSSLKKKWQLPETVDTHLMPTGFISEINSESFDQPLTD